MPFVPVHALCTPSASACGKVTPLCLSRHLYLSVVARMTSHYSVMRLFTPCFPPPKETAFGSHAHFDIAPAYSYHLGMSPVAAELSTAQFSSSQGATAHQPGSSQFSRKYTKCRYFGTKKGTFVVVGYASSRSFFFSLPYVVETSCVAYS